MAYLTVLDTDFRAFSIVDTFSSLIWNERYSEYGDVELKVPATLENVQRLKEDYYLTRIDSKKAMIIETFELDSDPDSGSSILITGRSLESLLERRVIKTQTILNGDLQSQVKKLLDENAINPSDEARKIPGLIFEETTDPVITSLTVRTQFTGDNLYDAIKSICESNSIGFEIYLSNDFKFVFHLYAGKDRSYDQTANPYVVFSPDFDNLAGSNFIESKKDLKTVAWVAGEGEGTDRIIYSIGIYDNDKGLSLREMWVDARDISRTDSEGNEISLDDYNTLLASRGKEKLAEHKTTKVFDGSIDLISNQFIFGTDYFLGDVVQIANEYGIEATARITEMIFTEDINGPSIYPTFTTTA